MTNTPIYNGIAQSDLDMAGFDLLNWSGSSVGGGIGTASASIINIKDAPYSAAGDGITDDTAAIQAAIDYLADNGGGTIYFPDEGPYILNGPLLDTTRRNSQLLLPVIPVEDSRQFSITFEGYAPIAVCTGSGYRIPMPHGTRLQSVLSAGTGTLPSVICGIGPVGGAYTETTNIHIGFKNMILQTVANPSYSFLNLKNVMDVALENILVIAGEYFDTIRMTEPTYTTSYGIIMPDMTRGEMSICHGNINVFGFYTGIRWGELIIADMISVLACKIGMEIAFSGSGSSINRFLQWFCTRGIVVTADRNPGPPMGNERAIVIQQWITELGYPAGPWWNCVYQLDDPNNWLIGDIRHWTYQNTTQTRLSEMLVNGGLNVNIRTHGQRDVYTVTTLPSAPVTGDTAAVTDGTAALAWGATVTGGGSTKYRVWFNGTNWTVAGK